MALGTRTFATLKHFMPGRSFCRLTAGPQNISPQRSAHHGNKPQLHGSAAFAAPELHFPGLLRVSNGQGFFSLTLPSRPGCQTAGSGPMHRDTSGQPEGPPLEGACVSFDSGVLRLSGQSPLGKGKARPFPVGLPGAGSELCVSVSPGLGVLKLRPVLIGQFFGSLCGDPEKETPTHPNPHHPINNGRLEAQGCLPQVRFLVSLSCSCSPRCHEVVCP